MTALALCLLCHLAAPAQTWDFEQPLAGWRTPAAPSGVVTEPGDAANHAFKIVATEPHHTQLMWPGSATQPDFLASFRFRRLSHTGEPPGIFVYARHDGGSFRFLNVNASGLSASAWFGQGQRNPSLGSYRTALPDDAWIAVKLAVVGDRLCGKAWAAGTPEPDWQVSGRAAGQPEGLFGVGVWTSPTTPSTAEVLFDDFTFWPLSEADLPALGIRVGPRPPFPRTELPAVTGPFETTGYVGVAGERLALVFDREHLDLAHLIDRRTGRDWADAEELLSLFSLTATKPGSGRSEQIEAGTFRKRVAEIVGATLRLTFSDAPEQPFNVLATVTAGADGAVRCGLAITGLGPWAVPQIDYPLFAMPAALGGTPDSDAMVLPFGEGCLLPRPSTTGNSRDTLYPGGSCLQFGARYDDGGGLYWAAEDPDGHCKQWRLRTSVGGPVSMPLRHLRPEVAAGASALPYPVAFDAFDGDWYTAADRYRAWAEHQPWCGDQLAARADIPQFLKEGSGIIITGIQNANGFNAARYGEELERLPAEVAAYRAKTGLKHIVFVPYGWENRGTWVGINYLPAQPSNEAWVAVGKALRAQGDRLAFLTSGYWWVVKRQANSNGPAFDDTAQMVAERAMLSVGADGKVNTWDFYEQPNGGQSWRGLSVRLCHGAPRARQTMADIFVDIAKLGVPLISFDQEIGGGQGEPCYSSEHGHPPGYGNWMWTDFRDVCRDILQRGKAVEPELGLFMENCSELAIPYMATYWSRQFAEVDYGASGARGIGLFSYLYHDYVTAIGAACVQGQGPKGRPDARLRCKVLANNLTRGLVPGPFLQDVPLAPGSEWHQQVSAAFFAFSQPYARFPEYLVLGRTVKPPTLRCETQQVSVGEGAIALETVTAGSFRAADGSVGTVIVNTTPEPRRVEVETKGLGASKLFDSQRKELQAWRAAPESIALDLEPFGVRLLLSR